MGAIAWAVASGLVAGLAAATPWLVYANRVVPSLARESARPPAYAVAAIPAVLASVVAIARLIGFTTGSIRADIVLIAAIIGLASSWPPIVRGALYITGGPSQLRAARSTDGNAIDDSGSRPQEARTLGVVMSVSLFLATTFWFVAPASASLFACLDVERILAEAEPPPPNIAPMEDSFPYSPPEPGAQSMLDFPMSLELAAASKDDPETHNQLVAADFVGAHVRSWIAEDGSWIEVEVMEFAADEGAVAYQGQVNRHACGYANEAFEAPLGGIGLQVRYEFGAAYVEQISWVAGDRRYKVQVSAWERPSDHDRILDIHRAVTVSWPPAPPPAAAEPTAPAGPEVSVGEGTVDEIRTAVETTLAEGTVWISKRVEFAGSSEIPDEAMAYAGGQSSLDDTRRMRMLGQFADTAADLEDSSMEVLVDGTLVYLRGRQLGGLVGDGHWLLVDLGSDDPRVELLQGMSSGHNDASTALFYLYGATRVVSVFEDTVHEQPARKYTVEIDLNAALRALPEEYAPGFRHHLAAIRVAGIEPELDAEVWIGEDGLVHHIDYVQGLGPQLGGGSLTTSADFSDFGVPLALDIPEAELVTPLEEVERSQCASQGLTVQLAVNDALGLALAPHLAAAATCWL